MSAPVTQVFTALAGQTVFATPLANFSPLTVKVAGGAATFSWAQATGVTITAPAITAGQRVELNYGQAQPGFVIMDNVKAVMEAGGNTAVTTPGPTYALFPAAPCSQLTIVNDTGADLETQQDATGLSLVILIGGTYTFFGLGDASQIGVRRKDVAATPITVKARWER